MADSHSHEPAHGTHASAHTPAPAHAQADQHPSPAEIHEIEHHIAFYWKIGGALLFLTGFTVAMSYMDFDKWFGGHGWNMIIGMIVATGKVALVMAIFMHLKQEVSTIWRFLYFTAFFVAGLFLLFLLAYKDPIFGTFFSTH